MGFERSLLAGLAAALVIGVSGCASVSRLSGFETSAGLPHSVELSDVAFYPQTQDQCGPAALATVLEHAGVVRTLQQLEADVYVPSAKAVFSWRCSVVLGVLAFCLTFCRVSFMLCGAKWRRVIRWWCCKLALG